MRRLALLLLLAVVLLASVKLGGPGLPSQVTDLLGRSEPESQRAVVIRVTDGDTLKVRLAGGREESVRILGINTPEVYPEVDCGGPEATTAMEELAPSGATVVLVSDPTQGNRDRYDRLLRYVLRSGEDVGLAQISSGRAQVFVFQNNPFERNGAYRRAERSARQDGRGSWAACRR